jgi:hypothetical protein
MLEELSRDHQGSVIDVKFGRIACERDKALAINSMQVWPDALAGLREMWRDEAWRQNRAWLYALFRAAERRT